MIRYFHIHGLIFLPIPHLLTMVVYREAMPRTWTGGVGEEGGQKT